jgi:hypothetical protein
MMAGREKASVFPDPVKAMPIMSRPEKLHTRCVDRVVSLCIVHWERGTERDRVPSGMVC